ncbi:MAG TPA: hypothetical protein VGM63_19845 [Mucilaginibacter sp.]
MSKVNKKHAAEVIPEQQTGRATDFSAERKFRTLRAAHEGFKKAAERLLKINDWHVYAGPGSSKFCLTNNQGEEVTGFAKAGFYFNINLPVPGSDAGAGLEWVIIENIEAGGSEKMEEEFISLTARPVPDPHKMEAEIAHFFGEASTSTFIIKRSGPKLRAEVHGRNETPNNKEVDLHDKIRNTVVALTARIGLSGPQWKKLTRGLLDF